ncbi:MAG TPA: hypothetical protein VFH73_03495 [Polyangia bacterium]|jgi:hypothetical protein|nr:hypothetical protein [Polyangia bacterium]
MSKPDAALLERLRQSGIRINGEGHFVHEGDFVLHEGLRQALFRWLDRLPDGRHILRLDEQRFVYLDVDDTPLVVRALRFDGDARVLLSLSDGREEPLDPQTLTLDAAGVLRCRVRVSRAEVRADARAEIRANVREDLRLEARLATSAAAALAERITQTPAGAALTLGSRVYPLPPRPESPR